MNLKSIFLTLCLGLIPVTAAASSDDFTQKLFETAARNPIMERHLTQIVSQIEKGRIDQVTQSTFQTFFQIAPGGQLSEDLLKRAQQRNLAKNRARFMGQYLIHDLNGDGAISSAEMEGLIGIEASQLVSLRALADTNQDGEISAEELLSASTASAQKRNRGDSFSYLMVFDLNDDDVVVVDEILMSLRSLNGGTQTANGPSGTTTMTSGVFAQTSETLNADEAVTRQKKHEVVTTNADGLPIELHMVGIYEPTTGRFSNPLVGKRLPVEIKVDRPGVAVTLVLGSYEPAHWNIQTTDGTQIETIIASGRNRPRGKFTLNGEPVSVTFRDLPIAYQSRGNRFQPFHEAASQVARAEKAASFHGAYKAPLEGFVIREAPGVPTRAEIEAALTAQALPVSQLPQKLRDAFEGRIASPGSKWTLREEGFFGKDGDKTVLHKLPIEAPEVSWPVGVAHDPKSQRLWGVTFGGQGYLYEFDIAKERWTARSMNNVDVGGIIYDPTTKNLITTPGRHGGGDYLFLNSSAKVLSSLKISVNDYPGLIETYDPGNGPRPTLVPIMIDGDLLLVRAKTRYGRARQLLSSQPFYLVNLQSGEVRLVR